MTIEKLMGKLNCTIWPESWHNLYGEAMQKYESEGLPCATEEYYEKLEEKYGMLGGNLDSFKRAAVATAKNKDLERLLALVSYAMNFCEDDDNFVPPNAPEGENPLAYDMIIGLAVCSHAERVYENMKKRNIPEEKILAALKYLAHGLESFRRLHGRDGYSGYLWQRRVVNGNIIPIGCFNVEISGKMDAPATVFVNEKGESVALSNNVFVHRSGVPLGSKHFEDEEGSFKAEFIETEDSYIGYPHIEYGHVSPEKITLKKSEWKKVLSENGKVLSLHIPRGVKFTPDIVKASFDEMVEFVKKYFPDENPRAIYCFSWLVDPQLADILPETSNIANFGKLFTPIAKMNNGKGPLSFVFSIADDNPDFDKLPEDNSLFRALKYHYKSGKAIYETSGYILI